MISDANTGTDIKQYSAIIKNYLSFWFWLDVVSCTPFDVIDWWITTDGTCLRVRTVSNVYAT